MYKLLKIREYAMTRDVWLVNEKTGVVEECFDDSEVVGEKGFSFMHLGESYECRICLLGKAVGAAREGIDYTVLQWDARIGRRRRVKVTDGENVYYIPPKALEGVPREEHVRFLATRKDLVQVNEVVHPAYLMEI